MDIVRIIDLKDHKGDLLLESEQPSLIKEAVFYLHEKTKDMPDEKYIEFLNQKKEKGFRNEDIIVLDNDISERGNLLFMKGIVDKLPFDIVTVLNIAIVSNGLSEDKEYEHLIDAYNVVSN